MKKLDKIRVDSGTNESWERKFNARGAEIAGEKSTSHKTGCNFSDLLFDSNCILVDEKLVGGYFDGTFLAPTNPASLKKCKSCWRFFELNFSFFCFFSFSIP